MQPGGNNSRPQPIPPTARWKWSQHTTAPEPGRTPARYGHSPLQAAAFPRVPGSLSSGGCSCMMSENADSVAVAGSNAGSTVGGRTPSSGEAPTSPSPAKEPPSSGIAFRPESTFESQHFLDKMNRSGSCWWFTWGYSIKCNRSWSEVGGRKGTSSLILRGAPA